MFLVSLSVRPQLCDSSYLFSLCHTVSPYLTQIHWKKKIQFWKIILLKHDSFNKLYTIISQIYLNYQHETLAQSSEAALLAKADGTVLHASPCSSCGIAMPSWKFPWFNHASMIIHDQKHVLFLSCWTGVCDDCGVWVGVHHPYLVGRMLLSLQRMAGSTPLRQEAILCHRWVAGDLWFSFPAGAEFFNLLVAFSLSSSGVQSSS